MSGICENPENPNIVNIALFADILQIVKIGLMLTIYPFPIYDRTLSLAGNPVPCVGVANAPPLNDLVLHGLFQRRGFVRIDHGAFLR